MGNTGGGTSKFVGILLSLRSSPARNPTVLVTAGKSLVDEEI